MEKLDPLIEILQLQPHPEGGYYRETYRSSETIRPPAEMQIEGNRNLSTAIYFLLTRGNFSAFHRIKQDEAWHHYLGNPVAIHTISPEGDYRKLILGTDLSKGERPQHLVPARTWFASETLGEYSLAGCTVAPGFDFNDFEMPERGRLLEEFPSQRQLIERLTREG